LQLGRLGTIELLAIIAGLVIVILLLALAFSFIFVVTGILIIFGLSALAIGFFYYNIIDGSLVTALWIIPVLLVLVIAILIILGWLSVIPPKFNRKEKTSFKLRGFNIIILTLLISLMTAFFLAENISILQSEIPSLQI
jgi:hypothetical protein